MSIAYPNLPVRLVGFLPGITTPGGVTHQAIDDIAILRAVPNMTILETGDATEVESVLDVAHAVDGPVYIRMLRGEVPRLFPVSEPMVLGRARVLGTGGEALESPSDLVVVTSGISTEEALRAVPAVRDAGVAVTHLHVSTHKPFNDPAILAALRGARHGVVTMENHLITGGLGSAVAEVMADNGIGVPLRRLGLKDTYAHGASQGYLLAEYHLDARSLVAAMESLLGRDLGIAEESLAEIRVAAVHSDAKVEAL
jgi:transketolase